MRSAERISGGRRLLLLALGALCLAACANLPSPVGNALLLQRSQLQSFALEGRFSLHHEDKSYTGRLSWRHAGDRDVLLLATPFGQGMAEIVSDAEGARLTASDGASHTAANAEALTQKVLGYPLPLSQLLGWLSGTGGSALPDAFGRPLHLRQEAWRIDYEYDSDDPQALPGRLFVQREGGLELRLRIDEWRDVNGEDFHP